MVRGPSETFLGDDQQGSTGGTSQPGATSGHDGSRPVRRFLDIGPGWISAIAGAVAAIAAVITLLATQSSGHQSSPTAPATSTTATASLALAPATTAPVTGECSARLEIGADGNAGPLTCAEGKLNIVAWQYYAKDSPLVMSLGPDAIPDQVLRAMCSDVNATAPEGSTLVQEASAYQLAALYYGWRFGVNPVQEMQQGDC